MSTTPGAPAPSAAPAASASIPANTTSAPPAAQVQQAQAAVDNASTPAAKAVAEQKVESLKKQYKLKVDGKEEAFDFDPSNEEELVKHLQMSKAASKRMQESAELKKGVQELVEMLRTNPLKVINDPRLGISEDERRKLAESIMNNEFEELQKTPEQKDKEKLQKEYERLKQEVEDEKKARSDAEFKHLQEQQAVELDTQITEAISKSGLPKNARTVRYMAEALMFCLQNNLDLKAQDLVPYLKKHTLSEFKELIGSLPDEEFEGWLGKDNIGRLRKRNLAKAKAAGAESIKTSGNEVGGKKEDNKPKPKIPMKDWFNKLGK